MTGSGAGEATAAGSGDAPTAKSSDPPGVLPHRLDAAWLSKGALARLLTLLDRDGEEARVVGGAVRNTLLGVPIGDIDIATTALPEEVVRRVEAAGMKAVPTGIAHGTITVVVEGKPYEVTTLREDVETFGRHAKVAFGRSWRHDAERRDFTMNALYVTRDGKVHDLVGGVADLVARRVRFIGDPATRIAEDVLRILRFFRFHAAYGRGAPDAVGLAACIAAREQLDTLSRERVRMEVLKLVLAIGAVPTVAVMAEAGLLGSVLGGVPFLASFAKLCELEAALALPAEPVRRLGALAVSVVEDAERLRERLRLANAEYEQLAAMADGWWRIAPVSDVDATAAHSRSEGDVHAHEMVHSQQAGRALLYRLKAEKFIDRVLLAWSRAGADVADPPWRALATLPARWQAPAFPLRAADFLGRGVSRGPALGAALRNAEDAWIAAGFPTDAASVAAIADEAMRNAVSL